MKNMDNKPLVSICIPNYNNGQYLEACIKSALNQDYENCEVILVDDNSTDNSLHIAQKYEDKISIFKNGRNTGQPDNTNKCIELCSGKYAVILHSDDQILPSFASLLVPLMEKYQSAGLAVGERIITDEKGALKHIAPFYKHDCFIPGKKQAKVFMFTSFLPCQVLIRREIFLKAGGVDKNHIVNLDGLLWFKCAFISDVIYIREPVSLYRIHSRQTTARYNKTIEHMLEYYCTLKSMFKVAQNDVYLRSYFDAAVKRVGEITVRYCHYVMLNEDFNLARRYLLLAEVFDPAITGNIHYKAIKNCLKADNPAQKYKKEMLAQNPVERNTSYDPPEGYFTLA